MTLQSLLPSEIHQYLINYYDGLKSGEAYTIQPSAYKIINTTSIFGEYKIHIRGISRYVEVRFTQACKPKSTTNIPTDYKSLELLIYCVIPEELITSNILPINQATYIGATYTWTNNLNERRIIRTDLIDSLPLLVKTKSIANKFRLKFSLKDLTIQLIRTLLKNRSTSTLPLPEILKIEIKPDNGRPSRE